MSSYHARNVNAMLRRADEEGIDVDNDRKREATIAALREQADHIEAIGDDSPVLPDEPLEETQRRLRVLAEALEAGCTDTEELRAHANGWFRPEDVERAYSECDSA